MNPTKVQLCERIRRFQDETKTTLTDDEVKGVLCSVWSDKSIHVADWWEALTIQYCIRALEERLRSTSVPPAGSK